MKKTFENVKKIQSKDLNGRWRRKIRILLPNSPYMRQVHRGKFLEWINWSELSMVRIKYSSSVWQKSPSMKLVF